jgi:undecaprenyl diphosphate synthase
MVLLQNYLEAEINRLAASGIRLTIIGRRDRLPDVIVRSIAAAEAATAAGQGLRLRIALDYSARQAIIHAASVLGAAASSPAAFGRFVTQSSDDDDSAPEVDLLIRTGGEKRLSDFLLWESAYAELWFTDRMWPEFTVDDLKRAVGEFRCRERRFGGLGHTASPLAAAR